MRVRRPRFVEEESAQAINISPLIDIIFILLLFFIVTASFSEILALDIDIPQAERSEAKESDIRVAIFEDGRIEIEGMQCSLFDFSSALASKNLGKVAIFADARAPVKMLVEVMDILKENGANEIYIASKK